MAGAGGGIRREMCLQRTLDKATFPSLFLLICPLSLSRGDEFACVVRLRLTPPHLSHSFITKSRRAASAERSSSNRCPLQRLPQLFITTHTPYIQPPTGGGAASCCRLHPLFLPRAEPTTLFRGVRHHFIPRVGGAGQAAAAAAPLLPTTRAPAAH